MSNKTRFIETTLGEIASKKKKSVISGPFGSNIGKRFFQPYGVPVIRGNNLTIGKEKFRDSGFAFITEEKAQELNCYARNGDLIFTAVGTLGQVGIIDDTLSYEEYVISNKQLRITLDSTKAVPLYVYYWYSAPWSTKLILQRNVGSTVPLINLSVVKGLPIRIPASIDTQYAIGEVLENIGKKIEINNRINKELEAMAKLIYDYWFVQFDFPISREQAAAMGKPKLEGKPYKASGGKMVYNQELKREIPEGWGVRELGEVAKVKAGGDKPKVFSEKKSKRINIPIYANGTENDGLYGFTDTAKVFDKSITISARGSIGYTVLRNEPFVPIIRLIVVSPDSLKSPFYLYQHIKNSSFSKSGSVQQQLTSPMVKKFQVLIPDTALLEKFDLLVSSLVEKAELSKSENQQLSEFRDWLLPMLMNGQVTIKDAEEMVNESELSLAAEKKEGNGE